MRMRRRHWQNGVGRLPPQLQPFDANARAHFAAERGEAKGDKRGGGGVVRAGVRGLPIKLKPGYGHHCHWALPCLGPQVSTMVAPGQLSVSVGTSYCLSHNIFPRPVFVTVLSILLLLPSFRLPLFGLLFVSTVNLLGVFAICL